MSTHHAANLNCSKGVRPLKAQTTLCKMRHCGKGTETAVVTPGEYEAEDQQPTVLTSQSRHVPTLYSRLASSHTHEAAKSKGDSCCTTILEHRWR
jgi:hypothetical protein